MYASGSRLATTNERSVSTLSCVAMLDFLLKSALPSGGPSTPSLSSAPQPYAPSPDLSSHLSNTRFTPAVGVKSLLTRSRINSAGLVSAVGGHPMDERYSPILAALPKYATRPMERIMVLSKPAKTDAGGW